MPVVLAMLAVILVFILITALKSFGINREYQRRCCSGSGGSAK